MRDWQEVRMITGAFTGARRPLSERRNLDELLAVLNDSPLAPTNWGSSERVNLPYDGEAVAKQLAETGECMLYRRKVPKYEAYLRPKSRLRRVHFDLAASTPAKHWPAFFALMESVAAVLEPDFAGVQVGPNFGAQPSERDRKALDLYRGNNLDGRQYELSGIAGLCMRNYFGAAWIEQFGRERMLSLPIPVKELSWGGLRTDLRDEPWDATIDELHEAWSRAMEHLRPTGVLAEAHVHDQESYAVSFTKGARGSIPKL